MAMQRSPLVAPPQPKHRQVARATLFTLVGFLLGALSMHAWQHLGPGSAGDGGPHTHLSSDTFEDTDAVQVRETLGKPATLATIPPSFAFPADDVHLARASLRVIKLNALCQAVVCSGQLRFAAPPAHRLGCCRALRQPRRRSQWPKGHGIASMVLQPFS